MPYSAATFGFSSTLSLTTEILSACSPAISSRIGDTWRHGPHHSAQKSTTTGLSFCSTSLAKLASVTVLVLAPTVFLSRFRGSVRRAWQCSPRRTRPYGAGFPGATTPGRGSAGHGGLGHLGRVAGRQLVVQRREVALRVESGGAAGAGRGDRLPVGVVDDVTAGEDAGQVGLGGRGVDQDVALVVAADLLGEELAARVVPDRHEQPGDVELGLLAGARVAHPHAADLVLAEDVDDLAVPEEADLVVREGALLHDLGGPQAIAPVNDRHRPREAGEEGGLLHRRVAAADDGDVLVAEEEAVAGGAPGHAVPGQPLLARDAQLPVVRAGRDDDGAGRVLPVVGADELDLAGEVDADHVVGDQLGTEPLGLGADAVHQLRPDHTVREAGVVFHLGRRHQGPAVLAALEDERLEL